VVLAVTSVIVIDEVVAIVVALSVVELAVTSVIVIGVVVAVVSVEEPVESVPPAVGEEPTMTERIAVTKFPVASIAR
jgi:hypothetical protein